MASARPRDLVTAPRSTRTLVVLTVVGVLVGVVGLIVPAVAGGSEGDGDRAGVITRATDFAVTYNTYDVTEIEDYQERMRGLMTPAYYEEFTRVTDAVFSALESDDQRSGDANVLSVAVDTMDDDSAVALVAVDAAITNGEDEAAVPRRFRWKVTFTREDGEWLVSQFDSVIPVDAEVDDSGLAPGTDGLGGEQPEAEPEPSPTTEEGE